MIKIDVGDILTLKKPHPCGSYEWEVLRIGQDLRLKCVGCNHQMMIARKSIEKSIKSQEKGKDIYDGPYILPANRYADTFLSVSYRPLEIRKHSPASTILDNLALGFAYELSSSKSIDVVFIIFSPLSIILLDLEVRIKHSNLF